MFKLVTVARRTTVPGIIFKSIIHKVTGQLELEFRTFNIKLIARSVLMFRNYVSERDGSREEQKRN